MGIPAETVMNAHEAVAVKKEKEQERPVDWEAPRIPSTPGELNAGMDSFLNSLKAPKEEVNYASKASLTNLREYLRGVGDMLAVNIIENTNL